MKSDKYWSSNNLTKKTATQVTEPEFKISQRTQMGIMTHWWENTATGSKLLLDLHSP